MKLLRKSDGEWFKHAGGAEFQIRPIPSARAREIDVLALGRQREIVLSRGKQSMSYDSEKLSHANREKAVYALVDSRDCQIDAWDTDSAAVLSKALDKTVAVGEEVTLDGHWSPEIKTLVFNAVPTMVDWIMAKAAGFAFKAEEEEGKD
jgi:hypothetical protein